MPQSNFVPARSWGTRFDSLASAPPFSSPVDGGDASFRTQDAIVGEAAIFPDASPQKKHDKIPHDSSIFVGSLPSNIDQLELHRMLTEHFSGYAEVKNIKVVRDSKGGICAFVQCEDSFAAAELLKNLSNHPPRQFMGRYLRYEPARAFRTLLISYRAPRQFACSVSDDHVRAGNFSRDGKFIELELPTAMKMWRTPGAKHLSILYNSDAHAAAEDEGSQIDRPTDTSGLFLSPVNYDAETLHEICSVFGAVESFGPYVPQREDSHIHSREDNSAAVMTPELDNLIYPPPHDALRCPAMDAGCWEVKWNHRDDCVSALMTLRRIPHLTVTWAHQIASPTINQQPIFPFHDARQIPGGVAYRTRSQGDFSDRINPQAIGADSAAMSRFSFPSRFYMEPPRTHPAHFHGVEASVTSGLSSVESTSMSSPSSQENARVYPSQVPGSPDSNSSPLTLTSNSNRRSGSSLSATERDSTDVEQIGMKAMTDPSDNECASDDDLDQQTHGRLWGDRMTSKEGEEHAGSLLSLDSPSISLLGTPRGPSLQLPDPDSSSQPEAQELDIPPTPEFGTSPITPKTPGSLIPQTPTTGSYLGDFQNISIQEYDNRHDAYFNEEKREDGVVDPTTIFVGGLEMYGPHAWDEDRVREFFSRYGGVETVKVVRPVNKRSAFAFVKFDNTDSPARAVQEEHNRMLDGRPIRVQLRDVNPSHRTAWKYPRNRARYQPGNNVRQEDQRSFTAGGEGPDSFRPGSGFSGHPASANNMVQQKALNASQMTGSDVGKDEAVESNEGSVQTTRTGTDVTESSVKPCSTTGSAPWQLNVHRVTGRAPDGHPSAPITPSNSYGSATSATAAPMAYPLPAVGYYPPHPWMPGYQQYPYPMPLVGAYPGFAMPTHPMHHTYAHSTGSDASGPPSGTHTPFAPSAGVYPPFLPYPAYPIRPFAYDQTQQNQNQTSNAPTSQAPLAPTGFIQGEQGMLVPVYHPEALDRYMSGVQSQAPSGQSTAPRPAGQNAPAWHAYPQPPGYSVAVPSLPGLPSQPVLMNHVQQQGVVPAGWGVPGSAPHALHSSQSSQSQLSSLPSATQSLNAPGFNGTPGSAESRIPFEQRNVPPRRQYRRESVYHKNNNNRPSSNRYPRDDLVADSSSGNEPPGAANNLGSAKSAGSTGWTHWNSTSIR